MAKFPAGAFAIVTVFLASGAQAMGVLPNCLSTLAADTRSWTECTEAFDRQDSRCKLRAAQMSESMQRCEANGYSRSRIDQAMAQGASAARNYVPEESDTLPARPAPRPERGPIPGYRKPDET